MRLDGHCPPKNLYVDRAITVCIHTIVCLLIYNVFKSLPAALLFAVNVSNNQTSIWLNGKRYGIVAILCLLSFAYLPFLWLLTPFFQLSGATFLLLIALNGSPYLLLLYPLVYIFTNKFVRKWIKSREGKMPSMEHRKWTLRKIPFILKTIAFYFGRGLFPFAPVMYMSYLKHFGLIKEKTDEAYRFDLMAVAGLLITLLTIIGYLYNPHLFFGLVWWLVTVAVYSNWITLTVQYAERYCYLPNIGLMLFVSNFVGPLWTVLFGAYLARLWTYMPSYKNVSAFFKHQTDVNPTHDCGWNTRITDVLQQKDISAAMVLTELALCYVQDSPRIWVHKASILHASGNKKYALLCIQKARECAKEGLGEHLNDKIDFVEKHIVEVDNPTIGSN